MQILSIKLKESLDYYRDTTGKKITIAGLCRIIVKRLDIPHDPRSMESLFAENKVGKRRLRPQVIKTIAEELGVTTDFLMGLSERPNSIDNTK